MFKVGCALYYSMAKLVMEKYLEHLCRIYSNPTHDKHQWLLLQFIVLLMMDVKGVRNMYSILVVVNKHNTARDASCWLIIYYRLVKDGNSNIKLFQYITFTSSVVESDSTCNNVPKLVLILSRSRYQTTYEFSRVQHLS